MKYKSLCFYHLQKIDRINKMNSFIHVKIKETKDINLEVEWISNLIMDAIIMKKIGPLIHLYAYKEYNITKEIKKDSQMQLKCNYNCISFFIFMSLLMGGIPSLISVLLMACMKENIPISNIIFLVFCIFVLIILLCIMLCYTYMYLKEQKNYYMEGKKKYFKV
jgi:hypothetical protein